ncbi:MAG: acylphosphatase, partial [Oscillospiraceae bacterium]|nr:acylphosphatase [Oscillospiraceae bacterium]
MERLRLKIKGIVQGVGFRPWVHRMTGDFSLRGYIRNSSSGVELELEGERSDLEGFVKALRHSPPPLALIESVEEEYSRELLGFEGFEIRRSLREEKRATLISPDVAICPDCLRELNEPADRRYRYPFINCTNCGPRFTIIKDVPYDRPLTSMGCFPMCESCER